MSAIKKKLIFKVNPLYFCLDRQTAENFLCNPIHSVPTCNGQYVTVFQNKKKAIESMKPIAKKALENSEHSEHSGHSDSFRFVVFGFYFPSIEPLWVDEKEYKGNYKDDIPLHGRVMIGGMVKAKNSISIKDFFCAESWCFYKNKNNKLKYHKDYKIVAVDEDTFFAD